MTPKQFVALRRIDIMRQRLQGHGKANISSSQEAMDGTSHLLRLQIMDRQAFHTDRVAQAAGLQATALTSIAKTLEEVLALAKKQGG